jgi:hypothetical protein
MHRLTPFATLIAIPLMQGCANTPRNAASATVPTAAQPVAAAAPAIAAETNAADSNVAQVMSIAHTTEVPVEKNAPTAQGHPLTSVVVTQCNLIVAVYLTMPDGRLLRFDKTAAIPADQLLSMAYTATRSERVEVSCEDVGAVGYEQHEPL